MCVSACAADRIPLDIEKYVVARIQRILVQGPIQKYLKEEHFGPPKKIYEGAGIRNGSY